MGKRGRCKISNSSTCGGKKGTPQKGELKKKEHSKDKKPLGVLI